MQQTLTKIFKEKDKYGSNFLGKNKKALIEHTSINPNASPHIGRARNAIIGDSIVKLLKFEGYNTEVHYYVNDIGKQIAMLVLACKGKTPSFKQLLDLYIEFNRKMELDKSIEKEVLDLLNKLESGDKYVFKSFRKVVNICIKGQKRIFGELNIKYDYFDYESDFFFNKDASKILDILESKGKLFVDEEKRRAINLDGFNLPMEHHYLPLTRSDNTSLYMLRDLAYTIYKNSRAKDKNIIILGEDQKLYYQQLKAILSILKYEAPEVVHYSFVLLPSGKMSTRKGEVVLLEDFMNELKAMAKEEIIKRHGNIKNVENLSKVIAFGALKFTMLKVSADKNILFDMDKALSFEGDSGPYIQYSHARASSIIKKSKFRMNLSLLKVTSDNDIRLVSKLAVFQDIISQSFKSIKPHIIANYALELAKIFNEFYQSCPVLNQPKDISNSRIALVKATQQVLKNSLHLLGIEAPVKM